MKDNFLVQRARANQYSYSGTITYTIASTPRQYRSHIVLNLGCPPISQTCSTQQQQHPFNGPLSGTRRVSWYQKGKINLDLLEQETVSGSGICWAICKSAPHPRLITMPAFHHSLQAGRPSCQLTNSIKAL